MRLAKAKKDSQQQISRPVPVDETFCLEEPVEIRDTREVMPARKGKSFGCYYLYGNRVIDWDGITNTYIGPFMIAELSDVEFENPTCKQFVEIYRREVENGVLPEEQHFLSIIPIRIL